jgi:bifunctional ADP-heptose synthase (sugar kinase/adenylyltransferase)
VDVAGAGDVLLVAASLSKISGVDIWHSAILGMLCSGIHVGNVGNTPIKMNSLLSYVEKLTS